MWQALVAAAVAGSGLVARNVFSFADGSPADGGASSEIDHSIQIDSPELHHSNPGSPDYVDVWSLKEQGADTIFRFSSSGCKIKKRKLKGNTKSGKTKKNKKKGIEVQKVERMWTGVHVGIVTVKAIGELKNGLCKWKVSCSSKSSCPSDSNTYEGGEYPSSILTEEPEPQHAVHKMDQLEADLEYELSKLTSCNTEVSFEKGINSELYQTEVLGNGGQQMCNSYQFNGVEPSVLDKKLSELLIQQQESQINELECELQSANSKLHQKEVELRALKDCVRRLSNFSLSNISGNETETTAEEMVSA